MRYDDIINITEYRSMESLKEHPRMERLERARIFSPFAALRGYEESLEKEKMQRERDIRTMLSDGLEEEINSTLCSLRRNDRVRITAFSEDSDSRGFAEEITGTLSRISPESGEIAVSTEDGIKTVRLCDILAAEAVSD